MFFLLQITKTSLTSCYNRRHDLQISAPWSHLHFNSSPNSLGGSVQNHTLCIFNIMLNTTKEGFTFSVSCIFQILLGFQYDNSTRNHWLTFVGLLSEGPWRSDKLCYDNILFLKACVTTNSYSTSGGECFQFSSATAAMAASLDCATHKSPSRLVCTMNKKRKYLLLIGGVY